MEPFKERFWKKLRFYNYKLYHALIVAEPTYRTFSELIEDTEIRDTGNIYPARLSFILNENTRLGRIKMIEGIDKPILGYKILPKGKEYLNLLTESISYFQKLFNTDMITPEIVEKASTIADNFERAPKIENLRKYESSLQTIQIK